MKQRFLMTSAVFAALWLAAAAADAHEMTERYIPVGAYPALRSPYTSFGTVVSVDPAAGTMTLKSDDASHTCTITERTWIWLDRSLLKLPTLDGKLADIKPGMKAEIRETGPDKPHETLWVKVQVTP